MDRPTAEALDRALQHEDAEDASFLLTDRRVLAAEVRALRAELGNCEEEFRKPLRNELDQLRSAYDLLHERLAAYDQTHAELQALKAAIARVEALCDEADEGEESRVDVDLKNIPLDPEPVQNGNLTLVASGVLGGKVVFNVSYRTNKDEPGAERFYRSHFVTCPDAKKHRRPR